MRLIESYLCAEGVTPRACQLSDPSDKVSRHAAEVILHDDEHGGERFLCKTHAAMVLSKNTFLLARAVVEAMIP
jgi:hypothetical protein